MFATKSNFLGKLLVGNWVKLICVLILPVDGEWKQFSSFWWTYGSGVCIGELLWRTYCVLWKIRKANEARKSRDVKRPAAGRKVKPVLRRRKSFISCNCGSLCSSKIFSFSSLSKTTLYSRQACFGINPLTTLKTAAQVLFSVSQYSMCGIGSPLQKENCW